MSFLAGNTRVHLSAYSDDEKVDAKQLYYAIKKPIQDLATWVAPLNIDHYYFTFYITPSAKETHFHTEQFGGMASDNSSFFVLPRIKNAERFKKVLRRVACHEFLHLVTPYALHAENISRGALVGDQEMSQHLWLYEGVTEYFTLLFLAQHGYITEETFFEELGEKIGMMHQFPDVSLTKLSKEVFKPKHRKQYGNIYLKGAITAFALDMQLRYLQLDGAKVPSSLHQWILELRNQYGPEKSFSEEKFIAELSAIHPEISDYFEQYILDDKAPPYDFSLRMLGMEYHDLYVDEVGTYGYFFTLPDYKKGQLYFSKVKDNPLGVRNGDILSEINGTVIKTNNYKEHKHLLYDARPGDAIKVKVKRKNAAGEYRPVHLQAIAKLYKIRERFAIRPIPSAPAMTQQIRESLFK